MTPKFSHRTPAFVSNRQGLALLNYKPCLALCKIKIFSTQVPLEETVDRHAAR